MVIKAGDHVYIKYDAPVSSTNPSKRRYRVGRRTKVKVFRIANYVPEFHNGRKPAVVWAGTGGYWCETELINVEGYAA